MAIVRNCHNMKLKVGMVEHINHVNFNVVPACKYMY